MNSPQAYDPKINFLGQEQSVVDPWGNNVTKKDVWGDNLRNAAGWTIQLVEQTYLQELLILPN